MRQRISELLARFRRLITFGFVGVLNTLVDYAVFALCYELLGVPVSISQITGYASGSVCGYLLNSNVTFREGKGRTKAQGAQYIGIDLALTALSSLVMYLAEKAGWPVYIFKIAMTVAIALIHYILYKYVVFKIGKEESDK